MISDLAANIVGILGSVLIVAAYAYNVYAPSVNPFAYNGANLLGAALLTVSLMVHFNLASLLLEIVWIAIALGGLWKAWQQKVGQQR
ncbi:permease [Parasphingorhabdus sp.]|uniref:CBU_0592 family membrane protein n=1 Tax=Parasphingorhabdus sp. TaxID=2709688 RepID=UPI0032673484